MQNCMQQRQLLCMQLPAALQCMLQDWDHLGSAGLECLMKLKPLVVLQFQHSGT